MKTNKQNKLKLLKLTDNNKKKKRKETLKWMNEQTRKWQQSDMRDRWEMREWKKDDWDKLKETTKRLIDWNWNEQMNWE